MPNVDTSFRNTSTVKGDESYSICRSSEIIRQGRFCDGHDDAELDRPNGAAPNRDVLTAFIAHEVRQPLAAIQLNAETTIRLLSSEEPNLEKTKELVTRIADNVRRANSIIQRARASMACRSVDQILVNLNQIVNCTISLVQHELDCQSIKLETDLSRNLPCVSGDEVQLQQVISNLLINSIEAIAHGASERRIELRTFVDKNSSVMCCIRDTGPGIADNDAFRIFDMFFSTKAAGMGAGLAVCRSIIAAHGGGISASNHPSGGAVFRFWLPSRKS